VKVATQVIPNPYGTESFRNIKKKTCLENSRQLNLIFVTFESEKLNDNHVGVLT